MKRLERFPCCVSVLILAILLLITGCSSASQETLSASPAQNAQSAENAASPQSEGEFKIAYICQMLTAPWFMQEEWGIRQKIEALGVDYFVIDANFSDERCMQAVDQVINSNCDAVILSVTNTSLGPAITKKLVDANIPFVTIDDPILDGSGNVQKHVGFMSYEFGLQGGSFIGQKANEQNFFADGAKVKVMCLDMPGWPDIHRRILGYQDGIKEVCPQIDDDSFVTVDVKDGAYESSLGQISATLSANPDVTNWIVVGLNEDCATAALKIFEENTFDFSKALFSHLGGNNMTLDIYKKGGPEAEAFYCVAIPAHEEGMAAVQVLYDYLKDGKEIPDNTYVKGIDLGYENYLDYFKNGKMPQDN